MPRSLKIYVSSVTAIGCLALVLAGVSLTNAPQHVAWLLFAAAAILTGTFTMQMGSAVPSISVADVFFITCAGLYGPPTSTGSLAADSLVLSLLRRRHGALRVLFNTAAPPLSMFVASKIFFAVASVAPLADSHA